MPLNCLYLFCCLKINENINSSFKGWRDAEPLGCAPKYGKHFKLGVSTEMLCFFWITMKSLTLLLTVV